MEIAKRVVGAALLLFVAVSVGTLVFQEVGQPTRTPETTTVGPASTNPVEETPVANSEQEGASTENAPDVVMAYYFHNTRRCTTCLKIETAAEAALRQTYAAEIERSELVWQTVCMEEPEHEHFVYDFDLASPSLVAARVVGGEITDWALLDQTWALIRKPEQFDAYVIDAFASFLEVRP